ncbi:MULTISPECIES: dihydrofolate reductase family protein [unclassified Agrococcus]|uniref:dihydrofolate reductase family protein n=1 Tax=unclassified Agrococcus TaxID=2615065 RepID=UPI00361057DB
MTSRTWRGRVFIGTSADGKIAREDGTLAWLTDLPARDHRVDAPSAHPALVWETFFDTIDAIVMGRATYDSVLGFGEWPFGGRHVIVLTTRGDVDDARVRTAASIDDATRLLDALGAREAYVDGGRTIQSFLRADLVDELTISVAPIVLGSGRSLFGELDADVQLVVRGSHATDDGLVRTTYDVVRAERAAQLPGAPL